MDIRIHFPLEKMSALSLLTYWSEQYKFKLCCACAVFNLAMAHVAGEKKRVQSLSFPLSALFLINTVGLFYDLNFPSWRSSSPPSYPTLHLPLPLWESMPLYLSSLLPPWFLRVYSVLWVYSIHQDSGNDIKAANASLTHSCFRLLVEPRW